MNVPYRPKLIEPAFLSFMSSRVLPFWSARTPKLRLINRYALSADLIALQFALNPKFNKQVSDKKGWRGGQHLSIRVLINHRYYERRYSLVGMPDEALWWANDNDTAHTITLAMKPQGMVSQYLTQTAPIGTIIESGLPSGDFHIDDEYKGNPSSSLLCVAGGSGITPMLGIIREALDTGRSVTLMHYQRGTILQDYWQTLAANYPHFCYHLVNTQDDNTYLGGDKYISTAGLLSLGLDLVNTPIMVCGSAKLVAGLYRAVDEMSAQMNCELRNFDLRDNIIIEHFGLHTQIPSMAVDDKNDQTDMPSSIQTVHLRQRGRQFVSGGTLLTAAENAGVKLSFGCRQGICHLCRCNKISGVVKNVQTGKLSGDGSEPIQTCISMAMTDVVLDI